MIISAHVNRYTTDKMRQMLFVVLFLVKRKTHKNNPAPSSVNKIPVPSIMKAVILLPSASYNGLKNIPNILPEIAENTQPTMKRTIGITGFFSCMAGAM